jgi:hypothetical protein
MLRDLLDSLRCPRAHEEAWLVAMVHRADGPYLIEADLACPSCGAEFVVAGGVAQFDTVTVREQATSPDATRVAALLHVTDGAFPILLAGVYAAAGAGLADVVSGSQVWVNAPRDAAAPAAAYSAIEVTGRVPLGVETLAGAAIDAAHAAPDMLDSIVRAVRMGGRIVAPADTPMPVGVKELARDAHEWVAEVTTRASGLVELRRRAPDAVG